MTTANGSQTPSKQNQIHIYKYWLLFVHKTIRDETQLMPVADAVQTFVGIANENEFFSHHYLAQVFRGNIKDTLDRWNTVEEGSHDQRSPVKTLAGCTKGWFINLISLSLIPSCYFGKC